MKTGAELKARREELKITQQDLADKIGVSRTQLSRMENGKIEIPGFVKTRIENILYTKNEKSKIQFSDLEVGDYVYVRDDLVDGKMYGEWSWHDDMQKGKLLKIEEIECGGYINDDMVYTPEMIDLSRSMKKEDYLKMNETKKNESFYELQEVAFQAYKDGLINSVAFENKLTPSLIRIEGNVIFDQHVSYKHDIDRIKSLYTEEFVIETMADELKIKSGAELTLSNGMRCVYFDDGERKLRHDGDYYPCNFLVLKGATVKQSKGAK